MADVIIPLGTGSRSDNDELRILLRSIERNYLDRNRVIIACENLPAWCSDRVVHVKAADTEAHNKDANLHAKVLAAIGQCEVGKFMFCADDNVFMQPVLDIGMPVLHNPRTAADFTATSRWRIRMLNTFEFAKANGVPIKYNYECHAPQLFDGPAVHDAMSSIDFRKQPGLCIYTTWRVVTDTWRDSLDQHIYKETAESDTCLSSLTYGKMFLGYNDSGFSAGLRERLLALFPDKSEYER